MFLREKQDKFMLLRMEQIVKYYGSLCANDHVDLHLNEGEILAVVGENGAGKTTLMKVLYGLEAPSAGRIFLDDAQVHFHNPSQAIARGIGMVQQHFMLFEPFTVAENIVYGKEPRKGLLFDMERANRDIAALSEQYELPLNPRRKIAGMPVGLRQRVEILKVLYQNARIIIFDEPTAVLTPQEVDDLVLTIRQLAKSGKSIIIITHKLREVMAVADRAMVMREGRLIDDMPVSSTTIEDISFKMVGRQLLNRDIEEVQTGEDVLLVRNLCSSADVSSRQLENVNLHVKAGEIVGIAGVSGNGQTELVETLFGLRNAESGEVFVSGKPVTNKNVESVRNSGAALVPEDRYLWGCAGEATLSESTIMAHYRKPAFSRRGILKRGRIREFTRSLISEFGVKADSPDQKVKSLSGGNAQKLVVAREIAHNTPLLIACEPTRGIDIGAMEFIHILLVSSELSEISKLSDRIYVMYEGRINGEFSRGNVSEKELGLLMAGGHSEEPPEEPPENHPENQPENHPKNHPEVSE